MIKNMLPAVLVATKENKNLARASKNLARARSLSVQSMNVEDLLKYKNILLDQRAISEIK